MKILFIRFSSIGDIVLATPAIRCAKQQIANAEVHFLTKKSFKTVTEHNPYIDKFFYFDHHLTALIIELKAEKYDYVIDLHRNFRSLSVCRALKTKVLAFDKLSLRKFLLTKLGINVMPQRHITQRSLDAVKPLGVVDDGCGLDYFISNDEIVPPSDLPASHLFGFIAVVIGASFYTKKLPVKKLKQLCALIDYPIMLIGGKEDEIEGNAIAGDSNIKIYNACGKFSLNESADLIRQAKLVISHDTGMQYIACAYNKQVLAIWGGTSPKLAVEPFYGANFLRTQTEVPYKNYIVPTLKCQPCSNYGTKTCPKKHFKCMLQQDVAAIASDALLRIGIK